MFKEDRSSSNGPGESKVFGLWCLVTRKFLFAVRSGMGNGISWERKIVIKNIALNFSSVQLQFIAVYYILLQSISLQIDEMQFSTLQCSEF